MSRFQYTFFFQSRCVLKIQIKNARSSLFLMKRPGQRRQQNQKKGSYYCLSQFLATRKQLILQYTVSEILKFSSTDTPNMSKNLGRGIFEFGCGFSCFEKFQIWVFGWKFKCRFKKFFPRDSFWGMMIVFSAPSNACHKTQQQMLDEIAEEEKRQMINAARALAHKQPLQQLAQNVATDNTFANNPLIIDCPSVWILRWKYDRFVKQTFPSCHVYPLKTFVYIQQYCVNFSIS